MQSFSNEQSPNGRICSYFYGFILSFWCTIFVSEKLFQNLTNFYHNAPTRDIRLFMQSFSNEQSPNGSNLRNLMNFYHNAPTRDIRLFMKSFSNEQSPNGDIRLFMQSFSNEQSPNGDIKLFMQSFSNEQSPNATLRISTTMLLQVI
ncbi:hypothetical protein OROHE_020823 [Orobanche hederae]